jgi:hypothetical protein
MHPATHPPSCCSWIVSSAGCTPLQPRSRVRARREGDRRRRPTAGTPRPPEAPSPSARSPQRDSAPRTDRSPASSHVTSARVRLRIAPTRHSSVRSQVDACRCTVRQQGEVIPHPRTTGHVPGRTDGRPNPRTTDTVPGRPTSHPWSAGMGPGRAHIPSLCQPAVVNLVTWICGRRPSAVLQTRRASSLLPLRASRCTYARHMGRTIPPSPLRRVLRASRDASPPPPPSASSHARPTIASKPTPFLPKPNTPIPGGYQSTSTEPPLPPSSQARPLILASRARSTPSSSTTTDQTPRVLHRQSSPRLRPQPRRDRGPCAPHLRQQPAKDPHPRRRARHQRIHHRRPPPRVKVGEEGVPGRRWLTHRPDRSLS